MQQQVSSSKWLRDAVAVVAALFRHAGAFAFQDPHVFCITCFHMRSSRPAFLIIQV
jgi:hypothetical protein